MKSFLSFRLICPILCAIRIQMSRIPVEPAEWRFRPSPARESWSHLFRH